jgi:hypothetical protein
MVVGAPADFGAARRRRRPCARHTTSHSNPSLRIDLKLLQELLANGARLIEVLPRTEYGEEHLPGATSLPSRSWTPPPRQRWTAPARWSSTAGTAVRPVPTSRVPAPTLGLTQVYDHVLGKADWLAHGLPTEGKQANVPRAKDLLRQDVATAQLDEPISAVRQRVARSPYGFALVLAQDRTLLGRLRQAALEGDPGCGCPSPHGTRTRHRPARPPARRPARADAHPQLTGNGRHHPPKAGYWDAAAMMPSAGWPRQSPLMAGRQERQGQPPAPPILIGCLCRHPTTILAALDD